MAKKKKNAKKARRSPKRSAPKKAKKPARKAARRSANVASTKPIPGSITHTELASANPDATKAWCAQVLGWKFTMTMPTPEGPYHLFTYMEKGGGGIRIANPGETPGTIAYVNVPDAKAAYEKALMAGAVSMITPERVTPTTTIAVVRAPGGVPVGFAGP